MRPSRHRHALGLVLATAGLLAGTFAAAVPAAAADDPLNLGALQATPTSGVIDAVAKTGWLTSVGTDEGQVCPAEFRSRSGFYAVIDGTLATTAIAGVMRSGITYAGSVAGINEGETHVFREGERVLNTSGVVPWNQTTAGSTVELRHTCQAGTAYAPATDPYYAVTIVIEPGGAWAVSEGDVTPRLETSTALAASGVTATSATLTATVSPADASGTVTFKQGATTLGTGPVADGVATFAVSGLTPGTTYPAGAFTAEYSGDDDYAASTGSSTAFNTLPAYDSATPSIGVHVPHADETTTEPTGLHITVKPGAITLTGPQTRTVGQPWTATGELGTVTVNDDRQVAGAPGWTLNGKSSAFTASGKPDIPASHFGWAPKGFTGAGTQGLAASDLSSDKTLASTTTGSATANVETSVNADLTLAVPAGLAEDGGDYTAVLTLTLV